METVLGLSMTSTSVGWILLDGPGADAKVLDHDAFDLVPGSTNDGDISKHTAAVRGAQAIANSTGQKVKSVHLTWTDDAHAKAALLLKCLPDLAFDDVVSVRLAAAARTWARTFPRTFGFERCAVCIVESTAVTVVSFGDDRTHTFTTHMRESADGLARWLTRVFDEHRLEPQIVFLIGSRGDLELMSEALEGSLPMPVEAGAEVQLALARGAALASSPRTRTAIDEPVSRPRAACRTQRRTRRFRAAPPRSPDTVMAWTQALKKPSAPTTAAPEDSEVTEVAEVTEVIQTLPGRRSTNPLARFGGHAGAAAAVVAAVIALFVMVPVLAGEQDSTPSEERPAPNSATTSISVHSVPSPAAVVPSGQAAIRQSAVAPAPAVRPPATPRQDTGAVAAVDPVDAGPSADIVNLDPGMAAVVDQPVQPAPEPVVEVQSVTAVQEPEALPQPEVAPPAPEAPPAEPGPPAPPPPPDPVRAVLGPLFGALP